MSRVEKILQHILDGQTPIEPSMSRVEQILRAIAGESDTYGVPLSRVEKLLQKWHGDSVVLEPPQSRIEKLLYILVGETVEAEAPMSRIEHILMELIDNTDRVLSGIIFDGDSWFEIPVRLTSDDTISFTYSARINCNVLGSYVSSTANNNFSYYHGQSVYARYGDQLKRANASANVEESIQMGKLGFDINDEHYDFDPAEFVCETDLMVGRLPNSSQPKFRGYFIGSISAGSRFNLVPVLTKDREIGYRDTISGTFYANQGTGTLEPYE